MERPVIDTDFDFGFSTVSEDELKEFERGQIKRKDDQLASIEDKFDSLYKMIMPLLSNLKKDPEKDYILWPDRVKKIDAFIKKINELKDKS